MKKAAAIWMDDAEYDIQSAEVMLKSGRYFYVIFMCHLAVEKMLKAVWLESKEEIPPKVHDLVYLMINTGLSLPDDLKKFVTDLSDKSVVTRYIDGRKLLAAKLNAKNSTAILNMTKELRKWLKLNKI